MFKAHLKASCQVCAVFFTVSAEGDPLGQFAIIQQSEGGWGLILKEPLDREVRDRHTLRVMATDGKFEASVSVDVHVLDINDNSPQCEQVREPPGHVTRCPSVQGSEMTFDILIVALQTFLDPSVLTYT